MVKFLDLQGQYRSMAAEMDSAIRDVIESASFIGGPQIRAFEEAFAAYQGAQHCVGVANGTDALEIALEALDLAHGSEVIVPANSFIASSEAVTRAGLQVVFVDNDDNYTISVEAARRALSPRTSAIIAVHLYGQPANMDELVPLARERGIAIIEDAAQAHGAEWRGQRVGALGDIGTFSFYPGKNLGAYGDAGAIVTQHASLADRCRMVANHGRRDKYDHLFEGRNSRLDTLQAAVLGVKLSHLDEWTSRRQEVARVYDAELGGIQDLVLPSRHPAARHVYHLYVVRTARREALQTFLSCRGIQTGVHYPIALPKLEAYRHLGAWDPSWRANTWDATLLSLPIGDHMTTADARAVSEVIREFFTS